MDSSDVIQLIGLLILLVLSAFFSSAETAFVTCSKIRMRSLEEDGDKRARTVIRILDNKSKMLSAVLIGNNIVNLTASSLATILATRFFSRMTPGIAAAGPGIATGILTILVLIFGEISPKTVATGNADKMALAYARVIYILMKVLTPVIIVINFLAHGFMKIFHIDPEAKQASITASELRTIVDVSHEEGVIENEEHKMIKNVVDFGDSQARDVMVPRIDMTFVQADATYDELMAIFKEDMYTRIPVYEDTTDDVVGIINMKDVLLYSQETDFSITYDELMAIFKEDMYTRIPVYEDTTDDVVGIINMKDVLLYSQETDFSIRKLMRKPHFTYESKKISELLVEMRRTSSSITIVLDDYGATAGLITLEDLIEEIVGEIRDEFDENEKDQIEKVGDFEYLAEASIKLEDFNEYVGSDLESEEYDTLGGFVMEQLDRLPRKGETLTWENMEFVVEAIEKNRMDKIRVFVHQNFSETVDQENS